ncbi:unnamed protein product [Rhodiola kirilowii]
MVAVFGRSVSFTNKNPSTTTRPTRHVRSTSLPCSSKSSHPLISTLKNDINGLKTWAAIGSSETRTSAWLLDGLTRLRTAHDSLHDFLHLSHARAALRARPDLVEKSLADVLNYVDVYGMFQESLMSLKDAQRAACLTMRKKNDHHTPHVFNNTAMKKIKNDMKKLVSAVKISQNRDDSVLKDRDEIADVIKDVSDVTAMVSTALFSGVCSRKRVSVLPQWMRAAAEEEKSDLGIIEEFKEVSSLERMEEVMDCIDKCSERVFRGLINTRVSLLNVVTQ